MADRRTFIPQNTREAESKYSFLHKLLPESFRYRRTFVVDGVYQDAGGMNVFCGEENFPPDCTRLKYLNTRLTLIAKCTLEEGLTLLTQQEIDAGRTIEISPRISQGAPASPVSLMVEDGRLFSKVALNTEDPRASLVNNTRLYSFLEAIRQESLAVERI